MIIVMKRLFEGRKWEGGTLVSFSPTPQQLSPLIGVLTGCRLLCHSEWPSRCLYSHSAPPPCLPLSCPCPASCPLLLPSQTVSMISTPCSFYLSPARAIPYPGSFPLLLPSNLLSLLPAPCFLYLFPPPAPAISCSALIYSLFLYHIAGNLILTLFQTLPS